MNLRRALPLTVLALLTPLALTGCGIRPTAVPVDAGAPASRTACPNPVQVPSAPTTSPAAPTPGIAAPGAATATPSAVPSKSAAPLFSASPTASPSASVSRCP